MIVNLRTSHEGWTAVSMHADQIDISAETARELLARQFPGWTGKPILRIRSSGTVNAIFRVGDDLAARFPLRPADPAATRRSLEEEARASEEFGQGLGLLSKR